MFEVYRFGAIKGTNNVVAKVADLVKYSRLNKIMMVKLHIYIFCFEKPKGSICLLVK